MVPQVQGATRKFEDKGRVFQVTTFSGQNARAGMDGNTEGVVLNQLEPRKTTVLFSRRYWCSAPSGDTACEVNHDFFEGISEFLQRHEIKVWGEPEKMTDKATGHYFSLAKWSSDFIKLHPEDPEYDEGDDPDRKKK